MNKESLKIYKSNSYYKKKIFVYNESSKEYMTLECV